MTRQVPASDDLAAWVADEAERRVVGRRLIVDAALRLLREAITTAPDLVTLPTAPDARRAELRRRAGIDDG